MPTFLLSKAFWEVVGIMAIAVSGFVFYEHYEYLSKRAAQADTYEAELAGRDKLANALADLGVKVDANRAAADRLLTDWQGLKTDVTGTISRGLRNSAAATNPICRPSAADIQLFNNSAVQLLGTGSDSGPTVLSTSPGPSH